VEGEGLEIGLTLEVGEMEAEREEEGDFEDVGWAVADPPRSIPPPPEVFVIEGLADWDGVVEWVGVTLRLVESVREGEKVWEVDDE
jgi:hypothetical protein